MAWYSLSVTERIVRRRWLPVYSVERTSSEPVGVSENCQVRKSPALSGAREVVYSSIGELPMGHAEIL
jgi:hypothetical protein